MTTITKLRTLTRILRTSNQVMMKVPTQQAFNSRIAHQEFIKGILARVEAQRTYLEAEVKKGMLLTLLGPMKEANLVEFLAKFIYSYFIPLQNI